MKSNKDAVLQWLYGKGFFTMCDVAAGSKNISILALHPTANEVWQVETDIPFKSLRRSKGKDNLIPVTMEYVRRRFAGVNFEEIKKDLLVEDLKYYLIIDSCKDKETLKLLSINNVSVVFIKDIR